jgi:seryl-tRNA synthetase
MIDPKLLRNHLDIVVEKLAKRGFIFPLEHYQDCETRRKALQTQTEQLQNARNVKSKTIGKAKAAGEDVQTLLAEVAQLSNKLKQTEATLEAIQTELNDILYSVPNLIDDDVPIGNDETDNVELRRWGQPRQFDFTPQDHVALGEGLAQMDFTAAAKLSGSRFVVLHGQIAQLQRALIQFMLNLHLTEHGYREVYVPCLVKSDCYYGTGQLPKFAEDFFSISGGQDLNLISTAEVPVTNLVRETILEGESLPLQYVTHTPCFRSEAGSYGRDTRGMIRQHQFEKVELVHIVKPEAGEATLEKLVAHAERVLQALELPYRTVILCSGDTGFSAAKTYDLEVWLPSQNTYREISSCSHFSDFQARRLQARYRDKGMKKPQLVHTLNGSGVAAGRALVAIMENYQNADGSITIPPVLRAYMNNQDIITP